MYASSRDPSRPKRLIQQGLFRKICLSPERRADPAAALRERLDDIPELATIPARGDSGRCLTKVLSPDAMTRLRQYRWPGNVRELENLVRRLSALYPKSINLETIDEPADAILARNREVVIGDAGATST